MVSGSRPNNCSHINALKKMSQDSLVRWLQSLHLLEDVTPCSSCTRNMHLIVSTRRIDGFVWSCSKCHAERSIRHKSFLAQFPRISLINVLQYLCLWSDNLSQKAITSQGVCSPETAYKLNHVLRDLVASRASVIRTIGGPGDTIAIYESVFMKRKYNRGRCVKPKWVFGMISLNTKEPIFYVVPKRNAKTLVGIVRKHVRPQSTLLSDEWRSYSQLSNFGYLHLTVNHSRHFVDPRTGAHTNHIENAWSVAKQFLRHKRVTNAVSLQKWLNVYTWRKWKGESWPGGVFVCLLNEIRAAYKL